MGHRILSFPTKSVIHDDFAKFTIMELSANQFAAGFAAIFEVILPETTDNLCQVESVTGTMPSWFPPRLLKHYHHNDIR